MTTAEQSWSWHLGRVAALVLVVLLPLELASWLVTTDVADHTAASVAERWDNPLWRTVDLAFLVLALGHGAAGVIRQGTTMRPAWARSLVSMGALAVAASLIVLGSYSLFTHGLD